MQLATYLIILSQTEKINFSTTLLMKFKACAAIRKIQQSQIIVSKISSLYYMKMIFFDAILILILREKILSVFIFARLNKIRNFNNDVQHYILHLYQIQMRQITSILLRNS